MKILNVYKYKNLVTLGTAHGHQSLCFFLSSHRVRVRRTIRGMMPIKNVDTVIDFQPITM